MERKSFEWGSKRRQRIRLIFAVRRRYLAEFGFEYIFRFDFDFDLDLDFDIDF